MIDTEEVRIIEMMERIENYVFGRLTQDEIDELWMEFLKDPHWFDYFLTLVHFKARPNTYRKFFKKNIIAECSILPMHGGSQHPISTSWLTR